MSGEQRAPPGACHEMRRRASAVGNAVIDEFLGGHISRRELLRYLSVLGLSGPLWGVTPAQAARANGTPGATVTVGMTVPAGLIDPLTVADTGGVCLLSQTAEYLAVSGPDLHLQPVLAESWQPNEDGSVWTFKIRRGVKFHDGRALSAADVVATMDRLADPANGSVALSAFSGVLSKGGTRASDDVTVEFHLDAPNGSFPYLVSSDNYSAIILPADYDGGFESSFMGTGPFRLERYASRDRASFVRNPDYWGDRALPERTSFIFYDSIQAQILAMQGEQLDVLLHAPVQGSQALLSDPRLNVLALKSSAHQQVHMRCDRGAFTDARVRRALALCLNRETIVTGLFRGLAATGNDSPFAPVFAATDPQVPQRRRDLSQARELLSAAGVGRGFRATLTAERFIEIPDYAVVIQNAVRQIGVQLKLNIEDQSAYFGRATFGQSDWLDCEMGIEDYAHRGVPNIFLSAALGSRGTFNAAHFKNPDYDRLVAGYIAALDPASQREAAGRIQRLLLEETPIIAAYFYDWLSLTTKRIRGVRPSASGQLFLDRAQRI
ncbi:MAG TPA: ABC transporter substrate-binding protein [Steroidobacteraceae bacterium]|jgi:peptide/nickel transport system substrate-binding protein